MRAVAQDKIVSELFKIGLVARPRSHKAATRRAELPQLDSRLLEHFPTRVIHIVALAEDHLLDADLRDLDAASQAGTRVAVEHSTFSDALSACLQQSILLGVQAQAGGKTDAALPRTVAALTSSFVAICQIARRAVVAG